MKIEAYIEKFRPCEESQKFLRRFKTFDEAWNACDRGDWMLSAARLLNVDLRVITLAKGLCANTVRHLMNDPRSIAAVDAAIAFGRGEIGRKELADAYAAAYAAAAADAAYAAADVAAAYAAAYAAAAAAAAYAAVARDKNWLETANICRKILSDTVFAKIAALEAAEGGE